MCSDHLPLLPQLVETAAQDFLLATTQKSTLYSILHKAEKLKAHKHILPPTSHYNVYLSDWCLLYDDEYCILYYYIQ